MRRPVLRSARLVVVAAALLAMLAIAQAAYGWTSSSPNPGSSVRAATIGSPGTVSTAPGSGLCTNVTVSWSAASHANAYRIERSTDAGATWSTRVAATSGTSWVDAGTPTGATATWRVTPLRSSTSWTGPAASSPARTCQAGYALAAVNPPNVVNLTWSAQTGATGYDIQRRIGANGSWEYLALDRPGTTYADTDAYNPGQSISYRVKWVDAGGTRDSGWSNVATIASWSGTSGGTGGLEVTRVIGSSWADGCGTRYSVTTTVTNTSSSTITAWQAVLGIGTYPYNGTITSTGNVTTVSNNGTTWVVAGPAWQPNLNAGASYQFTYQACRPGGGEPTTSPSVAVTVDNSWGSGWQGTVTLTTSSPVAVTWQATIRRSAPPFTTGTPWPVSTPTIYNADTVSFDANTWVIKGKSYNSTIVAGQTIALGFQAAIP